MTAFVTMHQRIGLVGGVVRGPPPSSCTSQSCKEYLTEKCGACEKRPIKSVEIGYGGDPDITAAIRAGLVTPEQVEQFRKQITGEV